MFLIFLHFRVSASKGIVDSPASELLFGVTNVSGPEKAGVITDSKMVVSLLTLRFDTSLHFFLIIRKKHPRRENRIISLNAGYLFLKKHTCWELTFMFTSLLLTVVFHLIASSLQTSHTTLILCSYVVWADLMCKIK